MSQNIEGQDQPPIINCTQWNKSSFEMHDPYLKPYLPPRSVKVIGNYQFSFDHKLGSGLTSDAYVGINRLTNEMVCIKIVDRQTFKKPQQKVLMDNQITCQKKANSQYTVKLYDVIQTNSFCFIVTQLCDHGDLYKIINQTYRGLEQNLVIKFAKDIAQGMLTLKKNQIIHRDIKSQNILVSKGRAKIGDFGFAIQQCNLPEKEKFSIGSPIYMSLEALKQKKYSYASDIFSFGIVLYQMLHKESPWECSDEDQLINKMENSPIKYKNQLTNEMKQLINSCLEKNIEKRNTIENILTSTLFKDI